MVNKAPKLLFPMNKLIHGDCLDVLKTMSDELVDLIYLDPPFFSNAVYEKTNSANGIKASFNDRWKGGIEQYIAWLKERVQQMRRILKPTGSIFLHCDHHANAYIRVFALDAVFGSNSFRNEIIWRRNEIWRKYSNSNLDAAADTIFWYSKSMQYTYNPQYISNTADPKHNYNKVDEQGRRYCEVLITVNKSLGVRKKGMYEYKGYTPDYGWRVDIDTLKQMDQQGLLVWRNGACKTYKKYLEERMERMDSLWCGIVSCRGKERADYPTQKPIALLQRIIGMASNAGGIVLDPCCGSGTTCAAAERMGRQWIGIDISKTAMKISAKRMKDASAEFKIVSP
jgi:DNA modification methylase